MQTDYSSTYAYAYPTSVTTPVPDTTGVHGSSTAFTTSTTYDYNTGLPLTVTDPNGAVTEMEYDDPLLRPTKVTTGYGTALAAETVTEYGAGTSEATRWVKVKTQIDGTNWKEAVSWFDGLGRNVKSQSIDTQNGDVFVETEYDNMGRVKKASNPYRTGDTKFWTENFYDAAGRLFKVKTPDDAEVETTYGLATSGSCLGTTVIVEDQADKVRRSITNALGQLCRVDEPDANNQLGAVNSPNQDTSYSYDTLNNLTTVTQGVQTRTFTYDALSRLKSATNPESGTINYSYDSNGNLTQKTDARTITTNYVYDALNRVVTRNYSDSTPDVTYYYDNLTNGKGRLKKVTSSVSTTEYTSFDILGRVTAHKQTTDGEEYATEYTYNLSGAMVEETYPSGRKIKNVLDNNGDLSIVQSKKNSNFGFHNYAQNFTYSASGAVTSMQLGNGRWEGTVFNSRLQPTEIKLGAVQGGSENLKLEYGYGTTANNGNVVSQTITVPSVGQTPGFVAVQNYTYDGLNRINDAVENITPVGGSSSQSWKQAFTYDRYGNRNFDEEETTTLPKNCGTSPNFTVCVADKKVYNPSVDASNNRLSSSDDYVYDSSGNTIEDAQGRQFTYDAENKQVLVKDQYDNTIGQYVYDGDGKRIKKVVPDTGEVTIFVYDAAGKTVAEYSTEISQTPKVSYTTSDHLGSPRIITDENGMTISRRDFMPFGEDVYTPERTQNLGYGPDDIRQKFTGYERDGETDIDYAQARMYSYSLGRFTGADNFLNDTGTTDPMSWNLYVYVRNNPLYFTDENGEQIYVGNVIGGDREELLRRINFTYGCEACVGVDSDGYLTVDTTGLSDDIINATEFLTDAINSTDPGKYFNVEVTNNNPDVGFGDSQTYAEVPFKQSDGSTVSLLAHNIRLDFGDTVLGSPEARASFLNLVFAHEVAHWYPDFLADPKSFGKRGPVVNKINQIRLARGLPLKIEYVGTRLRMGVAVSFYGPAVRDPKSGDVVRGSDGIEVETKTEGRKIILWIERKVKKK